MNLLLDEKQELLEMDELKERALSTLKFMNIEHQKLELKNDIQSKVHKDINQQQREYFTSTNKNYPRGVRRVSHDQEIDEMRKQAKSKKWDKKVNEHFTKELTKLQRLNPQVAEYSIQVFKLFLELPWNEFSKDNFDLKEQNEFLIKTIMV